MRKILSLVLIFWTVTASAQCLQTAPYLQTFNNDTTPTCWTNPVNIVFGTPIYWYSANNTSSNPSAYAPSGLAATIGDHTGNNGFYMYSYRGWNSTLQLTSPDIDVSRLSTPTLSYWMFAHTTSAQNNLIVNNSLGVIVLESGIELKSNATALMNISFGDKPGMYFVSLVDSQGKTVSSLKIVAL
jgi:hypothetical protein